MRKKTNQQEKKMQYEKYDHHNNLVFVRSDLKGKHREYCLCHSCKKLDMVDRKNNCKIAHELYKNCKKFKLVTPVWECPVFEAK